MRYLGYLLLLLLVGCQHPLPSSTRVQPRPSIVTLSNVKLLPYVARQRGVYVIVNTGHPSYYLNKKIGPDPGASAGWMSRLDPHHYSLLKVPRAGFLLTCQPVVHHDKLRNTCWRQLHVYPAAAKLLQHCRLSSGGYWLRENKPAQQLRSLTHCADVL